MAAGKTLAASLLITFVATLSATASGSSDDGVLWQYWSTRGASSTVFANNSPAAVSPAVAAKTSAPATTFADAFAPPVRGLADVNLNFSGPTYPDASTLVTSGSASAWYNSPAYTKFFGGQVPDAQTRQAFTQGVMNDVQQIFRNSNLNSVSFTSQPGAAAVHTMSVISGGNYNGDNTVLGMTYTGGNGFSYLDNFQNPLINNVDTLESAVAKNIAHELMHSFGGDHVYQNGPWVDVANTTWNNLVGTDPSNTSFSPAASANIAALLNGTATPTAGLAAGEHVQGHPANCTCPCCALLHGRHADGQVVQPVPEPSTFVLILLPCLAIAAHRHRASRRRSA